LHTDDAGKPFHRPRRGLAERRPKLVGWLIVLIIVLAIIGAVAVVRAVVR
jgi:hypothetical protein